MPSVDPIPAPESTSKVVNGVTFVWISEEDRSRILDKNDSLADEINQLKIEVAQKSTGLAELSLEIDTLNSVIAVWRDESTYWERQAAYWSERSTSGWQANFGDVSLATGGESTKDMESDWVIVVDWIDDEFGYVQLEWLEGVFVLWSITSTQQSKILERFHEDIFRRRQNL